MRGGRRGLAGCLLAVCLLSASACSPEPPPEQTAAPEPSTAEPPPETTTPPGPTVLRPGEPLLRSAEGAHVLLVDLPPESMVRVTVRQLGADVFLVLVGPRGEELTRVDRFSHDAWFEEVLVAGEAGRYTLRVEPWTPGPGAVEVVAELTEAPAETIARQLAAEREAEQANRIFVVDESEVEADRERALAHFEAAIAGFRRLGDGFREARARLDLAYALDRWEKPAERRVPHLRRAVDLFAGEAEPAWEAQAAIWLGNALAASGRRDDAIAVLERAVERLEGSGENELLADAYGNLGAFRSARGDWQQGLDALRRAEKLPTRPSCGRMNRLGHLGVAYRRMGHFDLARDTLDAAVEMGESERCQAADRSIILYRRCEIHFADEELERAATCAAEAVALAAAAVKAGGDDKRAQTRLFQGQVAVAARELALAEEALSEARELFRDRAQPRAEAVALLGLGSVALARHQAGVAARLFAEAFELAGVDRSIQAVALLGEARSAYARGELKRALAAAERSVAVVEGLRHVPGGRTSQARYLASRHAHYDFRVQVLMRLHAAEREAGWDAKAITACEAARSRSLLDTLAQWSTAADGEASARLREIQAEIEALDERLLWEEVDEGEARRWRVKLRQLYVDLEGEQGRTRPAGAEAPVLTVEEMRRRTIDDGSLHLSFHLGEERSYLWVVDRDDIHSFLLGPAEEIESLARRVQHLGHASPLRRRDAESALLALSQALLAPAAERLGGGERLLISPEGALFYVPFAALRLPRDGRARRLVDVHEVVLTPSASILAEQRRLLAARPPAPRSVAVVSDPVFGPDDARLGSHRPASPPSRRSGTRDFGRLPHTAAEANHLLSLVPAEPPPLDLRGFAATAAAVRDGGLAGHRYVHLATHAVVSADDPRLVLSLFAADGSRNRRGWLSSREIYDLRLPAELVVLSACSTGLGEEITGEGLVGFTQGFFAAGARRVMVSLWEVGDESTAELMRRFYDAHFERGLSPAAALREAQRTMSHDERWQATYRWAGFQLFGEPR